MTKTFPFCTHYPLFPSFFRRPVVPVQVRVKRSSFQLRFANSCVDIIIIDEVSQRVAIGL